MGKNKYSHLKNIPLKVYRKFLLNVGCKLIRTSGGHEVYSRPDLNRPIILQSHIDPVPEFIIRNHLRQIQMDKTDCLNMLAKL